jgi:site-specific recombinase XerD
LVGFLNREEVEALLAAPDAQTWLGRRDHAWLLVAFQTGLRLSEMTGLQRTDIVLGTGAHLRCIGKGRKEHCTPLTEQAVTVLKTWLKEPDDAQAMLGLRCIHVGGSWEAFTRFRIEREIERLYPGYAANDEAYECFQVT